MKNASFLFKETLVFNANWTVIESSLKWWNGHKSMPSFTVHSSSMRSLLRMSERYCRAMRPVIDIKKRILKRLTWWTRAEPCNDHKSLTSCLLSAGLSVKKIYGVNSHTQTNTQFASGHVMVWQNLSSVCCACGCFDADYEQTAVYSNWVLTVPFSNCPYSSPFYFSLKHDSSDCSFAPKSLRIFRCCMKIRSRK